MSATGRLQLEVTSSVERARLLVTSGTLDETFDEGDLSVDGVVVLDLERVHSVSPLGLVRWSAFVGRLTMPWFVRCSPAVVSQINRIRGFVGNGIVLSCFAPYSCSSCTATADMLIDLRFHGDVLAEHLTPTFSCKACSGPMRFFEDASEYFAFVSRQGRVATSSVVTRLLAEAPPSSRSGTREAVENPLVEARRKLQLARASLDELLGRRSRKEEP